MGETDYVRFKREALAQTKIREAKGHTHRFNKPVGYTGVWEAVKCAFCPTQIKWHPVFSDTSKQRR